MSVRDQVFIDIQTGGSPQAIKAMAGIAAGAAAAAAAIKKIVDVGKEVINAYKIQEQAEAKLNATLKATGFAAGKTTDELTNMASALQKVTTFGDEEILTGQNLLLTFRNIGENVFPRATQTMLDMSVALGQDLKSSAIQLGKALNDPKIGLTALQRVGITFTDQQKLMIHTMQDAGDIAGAQAVILKELENQFGGVAEAVGETATGAFEKLSNSISDYKEISGEKLAHTLHPFVKEINNMIGAVNEGNAAINDLARAQEAMATGADAGDLTDELATQLVMIEKAKKARELWGIAAQGNLDKQREILIQLVEQQKAYEENVKATREQVELTEKRKASEAALNEIIARRQEKVAGALEAEKTALNDFLSIAGDTQEAAAVRYQLAELERKEIENQITILRQAGEEHKGLDLLLAAQVEKVLEAKEAYEGWIEPIETIGITTKIIEHNLRGVGQEVSALNETITGTEEAIKEVEKATNEYGVTADDVFGGVQKLWNGIGDLSSAIATQQIADLEAYGEAQDWSANEIDAKKKDLLRQEAEREKGFNLFQAVVSTAAGIAKALPNPAMVAFASLTGAAQIAAIAAEPIPAAALGADFYTSGEQYLKVGDNYGGVEHVQVTPMSSQNVNGPSGSVFNLYFRDELIWSSMNEGLSNGFVRVEKKRLVN